METNNEQHYCVVVSILATILCRLCIAMMEAVMRLSSGGNNPNQLMGE